MNKINNKFVPWNKGKKLSIVHKTKISNTMKELIKNPELIKRISEGTRLALSKPEIRAKMSAWQLGRKMPRSVVEKRIATIKRRGGFKQSEYQKMKVSIAVKKARRHQVFPVKDTTIEIKMQNMLKSLNIEFATHRYIKEIKHGYQCDIFIPVQNGIAKKTIIECFGEYWHDYPVGREIDKIRCKELREQGWRVLIFWGDEIHAMEEEDLYNKFLQVGKLKWQ